MLITKVKDLKLNKVIKYKFNVKYSTLLSKQELNKS